MKKIFIMLIAAAFLLTNAFAEGSYIGVKGGPLLFSQDFDYEDGVNMGLLFGHEFSDNGFAVEADMMTSISDADGTGSNLGELNVFTLGVYGVYRSKGPIYFKGKAGLLYEYLDVDWNGTSIEGDAMGISLGLGGGWRITENISAELEFTTIEADISLLSLGVLYNF